MVSQALDLRERIRALPGIERVLPALAGLPPAYLVGGAVRDLLRGAPSVDLDVAVEGDAVAAAGALADRVGGKAVVHERFGTATVQAAGLALDLATTRRERYRHPGALPEVEPASLAEDLSRRDFTVNAMAAGLSGSDLGHLHDPHGGHADLEAGVVRVLHRHSFVDDPTRLLRAIRYEARLRFRMDPDTEALARKAAGDRAFDTVSGGRVADELLDLLADPSAPDAVRRLAELGLDRALHPALRPDPELVAAAARAASETGADPALAGLAALTSIAPDELAHWVEALALPAGPRDGVLRGARSAPRVVDALRAGPRPSELRRLLDPEPPEALALALALGAPGDPVRRYLAELRDVRLEITGDDLVAAGVPASPALGRALRATLDRKLDGELSGRDEELRTALELAREDAPR